MPSLAPTIELPTSETDSLFTHFLAASTTPQCMQSTIAELARLCLSAARGYDPSTEISTSRPWTLIPVLRGGFPMYIGANNALAAGTTKCVLARCYKVKQTTQVAVDWLGSKPYATSSLAPGPKTEPTIILDTIIATGDTLIKLCDELWDLAGGQRHRERSVIVLSCYAAPDAIRRVAEHPIVKLVVVARSAERCDEKGYLVPYTNGDIGDKIFGVPAAKEPSETQPDEVEPQVIVLYSEDGENGEDEQLLQFIKNEVKELTDADSGGKWALVDGGTGISRDLEFPTFKSAWAFMTSIAAESARACHHPEWSNVYNTVSIKWTTHEPSGLSQMDVDLARYTDAQALNYGGVSSDLRERIGS